MNTKFVHKPIHFYIELFLFMLVFMLVFIYASWSETGMKYLKCPHVCITKHTSIACGVTWGWRFGVTPKKNQKFHMNNLRCQEDHFLNVQKQLKDIWVAYGCLRSSIVFLGFRIPHIHILVTIEIFNSVDWKRRERIEASWIVFPTI